MFRMMRMLDTSWLRGPAAQRSTAAMAWLAQRVIRQAWFLLPHSRAGCS